MQPAAPKNTWDRVLGRIESKVSSHSFRTWFKPTRYLSEDEASVRVGVPNNWFAEWLRSNYSALIQDALRELERPGLAVDFRPEPQELTAGKGAGSRRSDKGAFRAPGAAPSPRSGRAGPRCPPPPRPSGPGCAACAAGRDG